jgi:KUP system potassium uptake protein
MTEPVHVWRAFDRVLTLVVIVTLKYITLIMRADNNGEGGILALTALVSRGIARGERRRWWLVGLGIFGAAMFYGDGMITPAISVLGAVEGLEIVTPELHEFIVPITVVIIIALFVIQRHGTARVGALFGPIMCAYFVVIALLGGYQIVQEPGILAALNPAYGVAFIGETPVVAFLALGAVVLAVTGTEALYADMGHFGRSPIRRAWLFFVMPAPVINYFGQGSLLSRSRAQSRIRSTFSRLRGRSYTTGRAGQRRGDCLAGGHLGHLFPDPCGDPDGLRSRLHIEHTSSGRWVRSTLPFINWSLFVAVVLLVVTFRSPSISRVRMASR